MQKPWPALRTFVLFIPFLAISVVHIAAVWEVEISIARFTQLLLMFILLAGFLFALPRRRSLVALLISFALLLSWAWGLGTYSNSKYGFMYAVGFYLAAHIVYLIVFTVKLRMRRLSPWSSFYLLWWVVLVATLAPHLGLWLIPVAIAALIVAAMGAFSLRCNGFVSAGAALLATSDTILLLSIFLPDFRWRSLIPVLIVLFYLAGHGLIAFGATRWAWRTNALALQASERSVSEAM